MSKTLRSRRQRTWGIGGRSPDCNRSASLTLWRSALVALSLQLMRVDSGQVPLNPVHVDTPPMDEKLG